jgi:hypothetical protein
MHWTRDFRLNRRIKRESIMLRWLQVVTAVIFEFGTGNYVARGVDGEVHWILGSGSILFIVLWE